MKTLVTAALLGLLVAAGASAEVAPALPWSTVADLQRQVTHALVLTGCGDPRPMGLFVVTDGADRYLFVLNADVRWVIFGPFHGDGRIIIWHGTIAGADRLAIEQALVGTPETDVCLLLMNRNV